MGARGPRPAVLLLLAACLALARGGPWSLLNDLFRKNHVDMPKTLATNDNAYCNKMMWQRRIYFKFSNTFIHAKDFDINSICSTGGTAAGANKQQSKEHFKITVCTFNPWSLSYTGVSSTAKIVISCLNGLAVLFVKTISASA
ncbi:ribonuclease-like [Emydura macquarii macquarii]|uniref:ribonuclease-like n=1 Tax=Emydura macquarii macquarii TaxID=1129001 RepID=UPI00352A0F47